MSVFLSDPLILVLSVLAVIATVTARFVRHKYVGAGLSIVGFLLAIANITYALLLGAALSEVLLYVLAFALIGITSFLPSRNAENPSGQEPKEEKTENDKGEGDEEL